MSTTDFSPIAAPGPRRRIAYLSGTRADFGLMRSTLQRLAQVHELSVIATGMHLDARYGHTVDEIRAAGLTVSAEVEIDMATRSAASMAIGLGQCLQGVVRALEATRPDILLLLGDRGEMLAGAIAALHLGIVAVQVHGGERSGTVDEPVRHAISKLCHYHCVATPGSRERLVRMGEPPERICVTGAPGLDGLDPLADIAPDALRRGLGLPLQGPFALALFHPVVQEAGDAYRQTVALIDALHRADLPALWLEPNADAGSLEVLRALDAHPLPSGSVRRGHVTRAQFCAAMRHAALMAGNSSAGIIEAGSFGTPVINIGARQRLRERNANVIDAPAQTEAIAAAMAQGLAHGRWPRDNVYGDGHAGERIVAFLSALSLDATVLDQVNTY